MQHSFIVRIREEQVNNSGNAITWRGTIEVVNDHKRLHFHTFDQMVRFIRKEARIKDPPFLRLRSLLRWLKHGCR